MLKILRKLIDCHRNNPNSDSIATVTDIATVLNPLSKKKSFQAENTKHLVFLSYFKKVYSIAS